jgi:hypothetical protein
VGMPKRLSLEEHLGNEELERRYREARDPVERSHYQIVWLLARGRTTREVVEATGYTVPTGSERSPAATTRAARRAWARPEAR